MPSRMSRTQARLFAGQIQAPSHREDHESLALGRALAGQGFSGEYPDASAVSLRKARATGSLLEGTGARVVDGGIVGPPPAPPGTTL